MVLIINYFPFNVFVLSISGYGNYSPQLSSFPTVYCSVNKDCQEGEHESLFFNYIFCHFIKQHYVGFFRFLI